MEHCWNKGRAGRIDNEKERHGGVFAGMRGFRTRFSRVSYLHSHCKSIRTHPSKSTFRRTKRATMSVCLSRCVRAARPLLALMGSAALAGWAPHHVGQRVRAQRTAFSHPLINQLLSLPRYGWPHCAHAEKRRELFFFCTVFPFCFVKFVLFSSAGNAPRDTNRRGLSGCSPRACGAGTSTPASSGVATLRDHHWQCLGQGCPAQQQTGLTLT